MGMETKHDPTYCAEEAKARLRRRRLTIEGMVCSVALSLTYLITQGPGDAFLGG